MKKYMHKKCQNIQNIDSNIYIINKIKINYLILLNLVVDDCII